MLFSGLIRSKNSEKMLQQFFLYLLGKASIKNVELNIIEIDHSKFCNKICVFMFQFNLNLLRLNKKHKFFLANSGPCTCLKFLLDDGNHAVHVWLAGDLLLHHELHHYHSPPINRLLDCQEHLRQTPSWPQETNILFNKYPPF